MNSSFAPLGPRTRNSLMSKAELPLCPLTFTTKTIKRVAMRRIEHVEITGNAGVGKIVLD